MQMIMKCWQTTKQIISIAEIKGELTMFDMDDMTSAGYKPVATDSFYAMMDSEIAESQKCSECGSAMYYEGYETPSSYRAFAVCTKCGHSEEF